MNPRSNRKPALGQRSTLIKHVTSISYKLEPTIWSCDTGQRITWLDRCNIPKKYMVNQGCMSLSTYYLEYGCHLAQLHHRPCRCRCCTYVPTNNTASHDHHAVPLLKNVTKAFISFYQPYKHQKTLYIPVQQQGCFLAFLYTTVLLSPPHWLRTVCPEI